MAEEEEKVRGMAQGAEQLQGSRGKAKGLGQKKQCRAEMRQKSHESQGKKDTKSL